MGSELRKIAENLRDEDERQLHYQDAEARIVGAVLLDPKLYRLVRKYCPHYEEFRNENHRDVLRAIERISDVGKEVDIINLSARLQREGLYDRVGGAKYFTFVMDVTDTAKGIGDDLAYVLGAHKIKVVDEITKETT